MKPTHSKKFKGLKKVRKVFRLLWQSLKKFNEDNGFFLSAGIAFNVLINLIPFIMLLLALVGTFLYNDQEVLNHIRTYFKDVAPTVNPRIMKTLMGIIQSRQTVGILGFIGLIWTSTWVFGSLRTAFDYVFRTEKRRGVLSGIGVDLLMIVLVGILLLVSLSLSPVVIFLQSYRGRIPVAIGPTIQWILKYLLPFVLTLGMFFLIYKIIPHKRVHIKSALQAALFSSLLWELAKHLFAWYVLHLVKYSIIYGSLTTLAIFFLWVYYSATILVVGGELAYFLEKDRPKAAA